MDNHGCKFQYSFGNSCLRETYGEELCCYHTKVLNGRTTPSDHYNVNTDWLKRFKKRHNKENINER